MIIQKHLPDFCMVSDKTKIMNRRTFLGSVATVGSVAVAGCSGSSETDGNTVISETTSGQEYTGRFDVESGQTVNAYVENEAGSAVNLYIADEERETLISETVDTEENFSFTAESSGAYYVIVTPIGSSARASVEISIQDN